MRITCPLHMKSAECACRASEDASDETVLVEEDDEALQPITKRTKQTQVIYDIIHSPFYQVPVLYIMFKDLPGPSRGLPPPEQVYEMLVPTSQQEQMEAVGPMGALSMTDHPVASTPVYFVHPCRTAEAMQMVLAGQKAEPEEYLLKWIGVIGQSVGLEVPLGLARSIESPSRAASNA